MFEIGATKKIPPAGVALSPCWPLGQHTGSGVRSWQRVRGGVLPPAQLDSGTWDEEGCALGGLAGTSDFSPDLFLLHTGKCVRVQGDSDFRGVAFILL